MILLAEILGAPIPRRAKLSDNFDQLRGEQARTIDASRHAAALAMPLSMEHLLVDQTDFTGGTRWIFESGARGLMYYELENALDPKSFKDGTAATLLNDSLGQPRFPVDIKDTADLLGISYVLFTSPEMPPAERSDVKKIGEITSIEKGNDHLQLNYLMEKLVDTSLVATLGKIPPVDEKIDLGEWWLKTDRKELIARNNFDYPEELNLSEPKTSDLVVKPDLISFRVDSQKRTPVLLKFTYSPYWQVKDESGEISHPIWVTPGNMLIAARGETILTWVTPHYLRIYSPLSTATLLGIIVYLTQKNKNPPKQ